MEDAPEAVPRKYQVSHWKYPAGLGVPLNKQVEKKDGTGDKGIFTGSGGMQAQGINLFLKRFYIQIGMIYMYINTV